MDNNQGMGSTTNPPDQTTLGTVNENVTCATCSGATQGYQCASCGEKSDTHDPNHRCGAGMCQPNCLTCNKAQSQCDCPPQQTTSSQ